MIIIWNYAPNVFLLYCLPYFCCFLMGPRYFLVMVLLLRRTWNWWVAWSNQIEMALVPLKKILPSGPNPNVQTTLQPGWHMPTQTHPEGPNLPSKQGKNFVQHHTALQVQATHRINADWISSHCSKIWTIDVLNVLCNWVVAATKQSDSRQVNKTQVTYNELKSTYVTVSY